jgi:ubiquinone/menaquinone biosynthesis C-methylase UbiE
VNLGCGPGGQIAGFENLDNSLAVLLGKSRCIKFLLYKLKLISPEKYHADWSEVKWCDVSRRLPYENDSVDRIYSSHLLEHIPRDKGEYLLGECYRVLKANGVFRLVVPDLLWHARNYVRNSTKALELADLPEDRSCHDVFLNSVYGAYLNKRRYGLEHAYMYDLPTLVSTLQYVGFRHIEKFGYQQGELGLACHDSRPEDSLHLEARK